MGGNAILQTLHRLTAVLLLLFAALSAFSQNGSNRMTKTELARLHHLNELTRNQWKVSTPMSLKYGQEALQLAKSTRNDSCLTEIMHNLGVAYYYAASFEMALKYFYDALDIANRRHDHESEAMIYNAIANVYLATNLHKYSLGFYLKSLEIRQKLNDRKGMAANYINISRLYSQTGKKNEAWNYLNKAILLLEETGDSARLSTAYNNLADLYSNDGNFQEALVLNRKAYLISVKLGLPWEISYILNSLGQVYLELQQYDTAYRCFAAGLDYARRIQSLDMAMFSYRNLTRYYSATGNYREFLKAFGYYNAVRDSIFSTQINNSIAEMQVKYETESKEKENALQKLEISRQRGLRNYFLFTSVLILILVVILFNRYRIKRRQSVMLESMVEERTADLRKSEQRVLRTTIETEERERARFSGDLHDGLGPLLSTVKIHLELIRSRAGNGEEQEKYIRMAGELLDEAIRSTREIANDLVPNILNDFGLVDAVRAYIEKINRIGSVKVDFSSIGIDQRPGREIEKALYRIVLELINNTLKHSGATLVMIRMEERGDSLLFDYSDNGRGLHLEQVSRANPSGLGIPNIISRIKSLNGRFHLDSEPGKPFGIRITIPLKNNENQTLTSSTPEIQ